MVKGECCIKIELSIEEGCSMIKIIEVILGMETLEECKIMEVRILEVDIEVILGVIILQEVEVGLEKDSIQVTLGEMIEAAIDQDLVQDQVSVELESDALSVRSMDICQRLSKYLRYRTRTVRVDTANA